MEISGCDPQGAEYVFNGLQWGIRQIGSMEWGIIICTVTGAYPEFVKAGGSGFRIESSEASIKVNT